MFERDWDNNPKYVINQIHKDCGWVVKGEGVATRKLDGTCCMIRSGKLYKRQECKVIKDNFEEIDFDPKTGKRIGWIEVCNGPEDKWHSEGFNNLLIKEDGTYELVGPRIQGNPEKYNQHTLVPHKVLTLEHQPPRDFEGLKNYLADKDIEGIVFHHPDGRYAKIKKRDFGYER